MSEPKIYAYILPEVENHKGYIKIGFTTRNVEDRVKEQVQTAGLKYKIILTEPAVRNDGIIFKDTDVHKILRDNGFKNDNGEWFKCSINDVKAAIIAVKSRTFNIEKRTESFKMRPEQSEAVRETANYFIKLKKDYPDMPPKFLWNAKMRFGKTFAAYQLCKSMNFKKILILTFKPAVESAWQDDVRNHIDFEGWQFISNKSAAVKNLSIDADFARADLTKPVVVFGSFQDLLGTNDNGGIKAKNNFIHTSNWDIVIFDEYHFGAWRDNAKKLFEDFDEEKFDLDAEEYKIKEADNACKEDSLPITAYHYLYLSGTPFRALNSGEFIEEQIFNWTYSDEQTAKSRWRGDNNPYLSLPQMVMMAYKIPESINKIAMQGEFNEFDLNLFFSVRKNNIAEKNNLEKNNNDENNIENSKFIHENEVQKWLNLIHGDYSLLFESENFKGEKFEDENLESENLRHINHVNNERPPMPFSDVNLLNLLDHTLWFMPDVASCYAMKNLLERDKFFKNNYKIVVCAGSKAGNGIDALNYLKSKIGDPLKPKSITLSCGKLTTGVTVNFWTGVFMLRNLKSPETYFQTAFRVQSPWVINDESGKEKILKDKCYIFDFALDRALKQIADYSGSIDNKLNNNDNPEKKVAEFIKFLPVFAYEGAVMKEIDAQEILEIASHGISSTLLARRWQSALLVNVDNAALKRLMNNPDAMKALMKIEAFRSLNDDIKTIINKSEHVKKARQKDKITPKEKKQLTQEEKEFKALRRQIQEKLIKFITRIPVFMYLTDFREMRLKDVITKVEPELFLKVTGLTVNDFILLCSPELKLFNDALMDDAIFKFRQCERSSLVYTGLNIIYDEEKIGIWDKVIDIV